MKNQTYQLSKSGTDRLEQFKRDIENGDCHILQEMSKGELVYFMVTSKNGLTCVFDLNESKVKRNAIEMIDKTLTGKVEQRKMTHDGSKYFCVDGGCSLIDSDVELIKNK